MKIRNGFVTNSSSSSFVIAKRNLDFDQINAIRRHGEIGEKLGLDCSEEEWHIEENKLFIGGSTDMDNFNMAEFFDRIEIPDEIVRWDDGYSFELPKTNWRKLLYED